MSKHLKMIVSANNGPRKEVRIEGGGVMTLSGPIQAHSALYGDGKERYLDVTTAVQEFGDVWPEDWEELVYGSGKSEHRWLQHKTDGVGDKIVKVNGPIDKVESITSSPSSLKIDVAAYGIGGHPSNDIDVTDRVIELVKDNTLDIVVNNSTLTPNQNPFRGKKKRLVVTYSYDGGNPITVQRDEKEWLIIGQSAGYVKRVGPDPEGRRIGDRFAENSVVSQLIETVELAQVVSEEERQLGSKETAEFIANRDGRADQVIPVFKDTTQESFPKLTAKGSGVVGNELYKVVLEPQPMTATALTDLLIRRFKIPDRRLRGPMPIDLRDFHRNDLAKLFAELGFTKGVEVGVAEGHYSEVLCKSIPNLELLCVDPWHRYSGNPWAHSQEHQDFSKAETERKLKGYNAKLIQDYSMNAVRDVPEGSLDFCYIDGNHFFDYCMGDLIEWSKRVRSGGIVALDDFYHFKRTWGGVVEAVQAYTNAHKITLWFAIDAPNSVDVFWVKP